MTNARSTGLAAIAMAWCAGFVDAGCYLRLHRTYTSHVTGDTAHLASRIANGQWHDAARFAWAIACFLIGLLISATLQHIERREGIRSAFALVLGLEALLLAIFIPLSAAAGVSILLLIFLPAAAMGMQTVTVTRVHHLRLYTTFLTGNLSEFVESITAYFFWAWDQTGGAFPARLFRMLRVTPRPETVRHAVVTVGIWTAFLIGAVCGVAGADGWGSVALAAPIAVLLGLAALDVRRPSSVGDKPP